MQNVLNYGFQHPLTWEVSFLALFWNGGAAKQIVRAWLDRVILDEAGKFL